MIKTPGGRNRLTRWIEYCSSDFIQVFRASYKSSTPIKEGDSHCHTLDIACSDDVVMLDHEPSRGDFNVQLERGFFSPKSQDKNITAYCILYIAIASVRRQQGIFVTKRESPGP
jgi:hypothetical protein